MSGGLYKSINGGESWSLVLSVNKWTGVTDVVVDPSDENIMYAATWQRHRNVAAYMGGGPGTKLFKSIDGGDSWKQLKTGLPNGKLVFAILFFISFVAIIIMSYKKDLKGLKGSYSGIRWVIIGFICFVSLLVILKKLSVS